MKDIKLAAFYQMSFVRLVRYISCITIVCITIFPNTFVPRRTLFGQSDNQTPSGTPSTTTQSTENSQTSSTVIDSRELAIAELDAQLELYLSRMTSADKIGQLFVISFEGSDVGPESDIAKLIYDYRVGGVVLSPRNNNFSNKKTLDPDDAIGEVARITNKLQALTYGKSWDAQYESGVALPSIAITTAITSLVNITEPVNMPLFIGVEQAGDGPSQEGLPDTSLRRGFTELPSQLAIGATWNTELAKDVGSIVGKELSAVGINMLLGPFLDVFNQPPTTKTGALGIYSFGGDPYWVGRMGQAYVEGVHRGSNGSVLSIARHFPGQGDSDRLPLDEIATIPSDEQRLKRIHLPPFTTVTSNISGTVASPQFDAAIVDGLMTSHMHFSGLQGDPDGEREPFGFSPALAEAMEPFGEWRRDGLMMTSPLDTLAIRKNFGISESDFPYRFFAQRAFDQGHDLLYISLPESAAERDTFQANVVDLITHFIALYEKEGNRPFKEQVDQSVRRILKAKLRLYDVDDALIESIQSQEDSALPDTEEANRTILTATLTTQLTATAQITSSVPVTASNNLTNSQAETGVQAPEVNSSADSGAGGITSTLTLSIPLQSVIIQQNPLSVFYGESKDVSLDIIGRVATESLTLLFPNVTDDSDSRTPGENARGVPDQIVIITDNHLFQECDTCITENLVNPKGIADIIIEEYGYGINGTQLITDVQIKSFTFADLEVLLRRAEEDELATEPSTDSSNATTDSQTPSEIEADPETDENSGSDADDEAAAETATPQLTDAETITLGEEDIDTANWIIFAMLDVDTERARSDVVKQFLDKRGEQLPSEKNLIVFALNAPYFLDTTEISRLKAYYGVHSKIHPFLVNAVRTLFRDADVLPIPPGSPPVSVPGTHFGNLTDRLLPQPGESIPLEILIDGELYAQRPQLEGESNGEGMPLSADKQLTLRAVNIRDQNGNLVKDGTQVAFEILSEDGTSLFTAETSQTSDGTATRTIELEKLQEQGGTLTIYALSTVDAENGITATSQQVTVIVEGTSPEIEPTSINPEANPTSVPENVTPQPGTPATNQPAAQPNEDEKPHVDWFTLLISLVTILGMISLLVILQERIVPRPHLVRNILWAVVVGLLVYVLYGLLLPVGLGRLGYPWAPPLAVFVAMLIPLLWLQLRHDL